MASARYTLNIKPEDLEPEQPRERTKKEKAANWWYYHRVHVFIAAAVLAVAVWLAADFFGRTLPDYQIALVTEQYIPDAVLSELGGALSAFGQDLNGDGQPVVQVNGYQLSLGGEAKESGAFASSSSAVPATVDVYTQMAGMTTLSGDLTTRTSLIFLTDDPEALQSSFEPLAAADGSLPAEGAGLEGVELFAFPDCPALAGLALSEETRAYLDGFYIARRGFAGGQTLAEYPEENQALYEMLTAGAAAQ
ncbi:MAG TPA: hypothetical protein H9770_04250 [Candidatus Fournierella excrementigallinarum]|nr:hypothetical protein [Candidatus Fournierella excrementigallinarum]